MTIAPAPQAQTWDFAAAAAAIRRDGITAFRGALPRELVEAIGREFDALLDEALSHEGGAISRGPERWYFGVHAERVPGFLGLVTHPAIVGLAEHMLGPDFEFVEVAFDVPLPGAVHQPWHRDFPMPPPTRRERRLTSIAFNLTTVDVTPEMGPFEIAPGTQYDDGDEWPHGMFPPKDAWERFEGLRQQRLASVGDVSVRSGLAIHRGTPNRSQTRRPVMVLGAVAPDVPLEDTETLIMSRPFYESLDPAVRRHLRCTLVNELTPMVQRHDIEGLMMGV